MGSVLGPLEASSHTPQHKARVVITIFQVRNLTLGGVREGLMSYKTGGRAGL